MKAGFADGTLGGPDPYRRDARPLAASFPHYEIAGENYCLKSLGKSQSRQISANELSPRAGGGPGLLRRFNGKWVIFIPALPSDFLRMDVKKRKPLTKQRPP
jgi:hypothetical protein